MAGQTISNIRLQPPRVRFTNSEGYITAEWWRWLNAQLIAQQNTESGQVESDTNIASGGIGTDAALQGQIYEARNDPLMARGDTAAQVAALMGKQDIPALAPPQLPQDLIPALYAPEARQDPLFPVVMDLMQKVIDLESAVAARPAPYIPSVTPFVWTPTFIGSTTPGTQTYSTRSGYGLRIENFVMATCVLVMTAKDMATAGDIRISGLPFPATAGAFYPGVIGSITNMGRSIGYTEFSCGVAQNTQYVTLQEVTGAAAAQNLTAINLNATTAIVASVFYRTN